ncbi:hypothetical protein OEZ60_06700 [Defluviimonas sp. WL0024]|uniref:Cytochrome c domain-containing protein n=1 Tax=Albidovulum salinarum TaxID=2984153 RepID=A0ABT2X185_9RHOB|nr:hypothetical protein [Defluviimonas sp. WL0024]MCU9847693.1 hypothetical protein [Defluviimonas sp. WL0024]
MVKLGHIPDVGAALLLGLVAALQPLRAQESGTLFDHDFTVRVIRARCVACHSPILMMAFVNRYVEKAGCDELTSFLAKHHAPDEEGRAAIVEFFSRLPVFNRTPATPDEP